MDMQMNQMQQKEQTVLAEEQRLAKEQFEEGVRQYQPIMEEAAYRDMVQTQLRQSSDQWQKYLNTQVMDVERLRKAQEKKKVVPKHRASVMDEAVPEPTLSEKQQEKRLKQMRKQNRFATAAGVQMQETVRQSQERMSQEQAASEVLKTKVTEAKSDVIREKLLDDRLDQMLHTEIPIEVLAGDGLEQRYGQLQVLDRQLGDLAELIRQNPNYLQSKPPVEQERIQHYITIANTYHQVLTALSQLKGLSYGEAGAPESEDAYQQAQMDYATGLKRLMADSHADKIREYDIRYLDERIERTYQKYEQGYDDKGKHQPGYRGMREEIRRDYDWMHIEHVSDFYQMDGVRDVWKKVKENPQAYMEHKEIVDTIMQDMMQLAEALGLSASQANIAGALELEYANSRKQELSKAAINRVNYYNENYRVMRERMNAMVEAAKIAMGLHKPEDAMALLYLQEKEYLLPELEQTRENIKQEAYMYADMKTGGLKEYTQIGKERGGIAGGAGVLEGENARKAVLIRQAHRNPDGSYTPKDEVWNQKVLQLAEQTVIESKTRQLEKNLSEQDREMIAHYNREEHYALAKELIQSSIQAVMDFDLSRLFRATPEELLNMQTELQRLNLPQMAVSDIGKLQCPERVKQEYTQRRDACKEQIEQRNSQVDTMTKEILELGKERTGFAERETELLRKKKAADLTEEEKAAIDAELSEVVRKKEEKIKAIEEENNRKNNLIAERKELEQQLKLLAVPDTLKQELIGYRQPEYAVKVEALRRYSDLARGYAIQEALRQGFLDKAFLTELEQKSIGIKDVTDESKIRDAIKEFAAKNLIDKSKRAMDGVWEHAFGNDAFVALYLEKYLTEAPDGYKTRRYDERFSGQADLSEEDKKIEQWLCKSDYKLAGEQKVMIREALFRSFRSMMNYKCMEAMGDEESDQMIRQLSVGALLTEQATPEEIQAAKETNMEGLRTYVGALKKQYRYLMRKYGLGLDQIDPREVFLHYQEMQKDFANIQVDYNMVTHMPEGILDMEKEEDVLFTHQISYYNAMGAQYNTVRAEVQNYVLSLDKQEQKGKALQNMERAAKQHFLSMGQLEDTVASRDYLKAIPGITTVINWKQPYTE